MPTWVLFTPKKPRCCNPWLQLSFIMLEGNALMRRIEGVYAVLPCHEHQSERDVLAAATGLLVGSPARCSGAGGPCTGSRRRAGADGE